MDKEIHSPEHFIGHVLGLIVVGVVAAGVAAGVLFVGWNHCVPQVFDGREVTLSQSFAMIAVAWVVNARVR